MISILVLITILGFAAAGPAKHTNYKIPSYVKLCNRDQENFDGCLQSSLQDLFPRLAQGIKELDIPRIDPLYIEEGLYEFGTGNIQGKTIVKNAYTYGLSTAKFTGFKTDFTDSNNIKIEADFHLDSARVEGLFKQQGQFMATVFNGKGKFNITTDDVEINWKLSGPLVAKNGEKFLNIKEFLITPKVGNMFVDASNLFNGNEALSKAMLSLVNQYWRVTYDEMLPYSQEVWDKIFREVANRVFLRVPFDKLFPTSQ